MPTIKQLRAISVVAKTRSFTRAAEELALTQSAVSIMIKELEEEVRTPLFVRGRTLTLTQAGEFLCQTALQVLEKIDRSVRDLREGGELRRGSVRVAIGHLSAATYFPRAIALFNEQHPKVAVEVVDTSVEAVSRLLLSEEVEVGIGNVNAAPRLAALLDSELLLADRVYAVSAGGGSRSKSKRGHKMKWKDLQDTPVILVRRASGRWLDLVTRLAQDRIQLQVAREVTLYSTAVEMARCGLGVVLLPGFAASRLDPDVFSVKLMESPAVGWDVYWMTLGGGSFNPAVTALKQSVRQVLDKHLAET